MLSRDEKGRASFGRWELVIQGLIVLSLGAFAVETLPGLSGVVAGIVLYLSAVGIYYFERDAQPEVFGSVFDALWWACVTLTTVGYGDAYPVTAGGKLFTFVVVIVGLGVVAVPTGLFASALSKARGIDANCGD